MNYKIFKVNNVRGYLDKNKTVRLNINDIAEGLFFICSRTKNEQGIDFDSINKILYGSKKIKKQLKSDDYIDVATFAFLATKSKTLWTQKFIDSVFNKIISKIRDMGNKNPSNVTLEEKMLRLSEEMGKLHQEINDVEQEQQFQASLLHILNPYCSVEMNKEKFDSLMIQYAETFSEYVKNKKDAFNKASDNFVSAFKKATGIDLNRRTKNMRVKLNKIEYSKIDMLKNLRKGRYLPIALNILQGLITLKKMSS